MNQNDSISKETLDDFTKCALAHSIRDLRDFALAAKAVYADWLNNRPLEESMEKLLGLLEMLDSSGVDIGLWEVFAQ